MSLDEPLGRAAEALAAAEEVALACHVNPDPDAPGSMLGLSIFLRARGARTICSYGNEPFSEPSWVRALGITDALVPPASFRRRPPVMV